MITTAKLKYIKISIWSGAVFHKIVFSFKLAYIACLEHFANINIPIILDSPRGKEVDDYNIEEMIKILKRPKMLKHF